MKDPEIRIGVIGVGQIGKVHLDQYRKINADLKGKIGGVEIVAIADVNETEARRVSGLYEIPHVYTDFRQLLKRDDIAAVDVCLHNNLHMPVTVAALKAGKHVFCEKPMAGAYRDALTMSQVATKLGLKLSIQLNSLFSNETKAAWEVISHGGLGRIFHARSVGFRRRGRPYVDGYGSAQFVQKQISSGGAIYDMGVYHIARMLYLMDNPPVMCVSGKIYQETGMDSERRKQSGYNVEELGMGFVSFQNNITLEIIEAWAVHLNTLECSYLLGDQGGLKLEPFGFFRSMGDLDLDSTVNLEDFNDRLHDLRQNAEAYDSAQAHWVAALHGLVDLLPTAELALNTMLISEGIYLSDRLGREVTSEEILENSLSTSVQL